MGVVPDQKTQRSKPFLQSRPGSLPTTSTGGCSDWYAGVDRRGHSSRARGATRGRSVPGGAGVEGGRGETEDESNQASEEGPRHSGLREAQRSKGGSQRKQHGPDSPGPGGVGAPAYRQAGGLAAAPELHRASEVREELSGLGDQEVAQEEARQELGGWQERGRESGVPGFEQCSGTLTNGRAEIPNSFVARASRGFVEGGNNNIKVLKRRCYGIFNLSRLYQRLFLDSEGYDRFSKSPV